MPRLEHELGAGLERPAAAAVVEIKAAPDVRRVADAEFREDQPSVPANEPEDEAPLDDSSFFAAEAEDDVPLDFEPTPIAVLGQLPRSLRLPVAFRIDSAFRVVDLRPGRRRSSPVRRRLAEAVAKHLSLQEGLKLAHSGDWVNIPALGSDQALIDLAGGDEHLPRLMKSYGAFYKAFALVLPNADVVALQALITPAAKDRLATRAGVLRALACRDLRGEGTVYIGTEEWTFADLRERRRRSLDDRPAGRVRNREGREK